MNNISANSNTTGEKIFDFSKTPTPEVDQLIFECNQARENYLSGKNQSTDASTALDALNNIFRAFNTVAELGNSQISDDQGESAVQNDTSVQNVYDTNETIIEHPTEQTPQKTSGTVPAVTTDTVTPVEPVIAKKHAQESYERHQMATTNELLKKIKGRIWFLPVYEGDEIIVSKIREVKEALSGFENYNDLLSHLYDYINEGNEITAELFFLFHTIYTLDAPEKFYHEFRKRVFCSESTAGGKGEEIDKFLESIKERR